MSRQDSNGQIIIKSYLFEAVKPVLLRSPIILTSLLIFFSSAYFYGPEGRGVIAFLSSSFLTASIFLSLGLGRVGYEEISKNKTSAGSIVSSLGRYIFWVTISLIIVLFILGASSIAVDFLPSFPVSYYIYTIPLLPFYLWGHYANYLFSATGLTKQHDLSIFATRIVGAILICGISSFKYPLGTFLIFFSLTHFVIFFIEYSLLQMMLRERANANSDEISLASLIRKCLWPYLDILAQFMMPALTVIAGFYVSEFDLGNYNFAAQILSTLTFPLLLAQIKIQEHLAFPSEDNGKSTVRFAFRGTFAFSFVAVLAGLFLPYLISVLGFTGFEKAAIFLRILTIAIPFIALNTLYTGIWIGKHYTKTSSIINLTVGFVTFTLTSFIIRDIGIYAVLYGCVFSAIIAFLLNSLAYRKNHKKVFGF